MAVAIGKANYGGKKTYSVKKDVPLVGRIIPPIGDLASKGKWAIYHAVEWGYKGTDGRMKPFLDVHVVNRKTKMVEIQSPAYLRREALKKRKEELVAGLKAGVNTQDDVQKAVDLVKQFNLDKKFYVNVKLITGEMGVLKINYKLKQALDAEIKILRAKGIDPLSVDNGRFFTFSSTNATGALQDWNFTVQEYKETIIHPELGEVQKPVVDVMDQGVLDRLEAECSTNLDDLYKKVTVADVQSFIEEGAVAVDRVLGAPTPAEEAKAEEAPADNVQAEQKAEQRAEAVAEEAQAPLTDTAQTETKVEAKVETKVEAEVKTEAVAETKVALTGASEMTDDEYLASLGAM